jgi:hypothetical protein
MTDELVESLRRDWQSQRIDPGPALRKLRRQRWTPHLVLGFELLGCLVALVVGGWFAWVAVHQEEHKLLLALSAGVLLIAAPLLAVAIVLARRAGLAWHAETPGSILRIGIVRVESTLRAMRVARWHIGIIAAFVAILWVLQASGYIEALRFLIIYTTVSFVASLAGWVWMRWRTRSLLLERAAYEKMLAEMRTSESSAGSC